MRGLMMDYPLTIPALLRRTEALFGAKSIVSRRPDKSCHRYSYADCLRRSRRLAAALQHLGVERGDRVATLCWNHYRHLEAYFGIPLAGAVTHTLNLRLHWDDLAYIVNHAEDKLLLVDAVLWPVFEKFRERVPGVRVVVISEDGRAPEGTIEYESLLAGADQARLADRVEDEHQAAAMCYTSGTTGKPKGVVYSHRALALHSLGFGLSFSLRESDVVLAVVPLFHANAWGIPFACALLGATQVMPGPHLDPASLAELFQAERVTLTAGVPTIWTGLLQLLDKAPRAYDLSSLRAMIVGGSAVPEAMIRSFQERHGLEIIQAWGMTETGPLGSVAALPSAWRDAPDDRQYAQRARQGWPVPFIEIRARGAEKEAREGLPPSKEAREGLPPSKEAREGLPPGKEAREGLPPFEDAGPECPGRIIPWDGKTMGELEVRGPWVASAYYNDPSRDRFTDDGWLKTGDIVTIDPSGAIQIQDRSKDVIKSGGEWISSVALENALMGHPAVAEAAVVAVPHPRWQERPLAAVVLKPGARATAEELRAFLEPQFAKWWLPDAFEFVSEIPRTATGKAMKIALRERFKDYRLVESKDALRT